MAIKGPVTCKLHSGMALFLCLEWSGGGSGGGL